MRNVVGHLFLSKVHVVPLEIRNPFQNEMKPWEKEKEQFLSYYVVLVPLNLS